MFQIRIPEPCHKDWSKMTPTHMGAFCKSCAKEVVDFSNMSDDDVQNYLLNKARENTCGRFKMDQIHRIKISLPENILVSKIPSWKKFMAVVLLAFGTMLFGCDVSATGQVDKKPANTTSTNIIDSNETVDIKIIPDNGGVDAAAQVATMGTPPPTIVPVMPEYYSKISGGIELRPIDSIKPPVDTMAEIMGDISIAPEKPANKTPDKDSCSNIN